MNAPNKPRPNASVLASPEQAVRVEAREDLGKSVPRPWLTLVLCLMLTIELVGLSLHGWFMLARESQPDRLTRRAQAMLVANYPKMKQQWLAQTQRRAPEVAKQMSQRLLRSTTTARMELEELSLMQLEQGLDSAVELSADEFRQWLRTNHAAIEDAFIQIEQAPEDARLLVLDTEASLEEQLGLDLRDQAKLALEVYRSLNNKLERLATPQSELSRQERLERRTIRLIRALTTSGTRVAQ